MEKQEQKELIIYGKQPVFEVLKSNHVVSNIVIAREMEKKDAERIKYLAEKKNVKVSFDRKANLQKISGPVLHQGVVAVMGEFRYLSEMELFDIIKSTENPLILILDQIQDPHNLGAILRTAEIAGITTIIFPEKGSASVTPTVVKTSAGAVFHCPLHRTTNLTETMDNLQEQNIALIAMVQQREETIYKTDLKGPLALVIGSEGKGVRKNIQKLCDKSISIPGRGKIDSLNASVSTAVVIFEAVRQREYAGY
jgi:23S rRNA (guanosine2251-2'-O)-methyltransferase